MSKAEYLATKYADRVADCDAGMLAVSVANAILVVNEALEWAALQCEENRQKNSALCQERHVVDAAAIRAGKSQ